MARQLPSRIDQQHFNNAAKQILRVEDYYSKQPWDPDGFKENESGEKTRVFQGEALDYDIYKD